MKKRTRIAQSIEVLYFTTELHTSFESSQGQNIYTEKRNPSECMWFGCRLPVAVVSQANPGNAEICPGFPPPQAALRIILSNEGDAVYIDRMEIIILKIVIWGRVISLVLWSQLVFYSSIKCSYPP